MSSFSIDLAAEQINDSRSREYFEEVTRTFAIGCYRSSLVMLWTVIICDLVYKLQNLRDMHGDLTAGTLLTEIEMRQAANPNSPDWEAFLLDEFFKRMKMIESSDYTQLQYLQKLRHLSAHPVLTGADLLFNPTKEAARAQIRLALEAVLLKPPLFSKRIVSALATDLSANRGILILPDRLKAYLEARYFPNMSASTEREVFRAFWKFVFKLKNTDTDTNRNINSAALSIIYGRNPSAMRAAISVDQSHFSDVGPQADLISALVDFLALHPELYGYLNAAAAVLVKGHAAADADLQVKASFLSPSFTDHLHSLRAQSADFLSSMSDNIWHLLLRDAESNGQLQDALDIGIDIYGDSKSYSSADTRFARFIAPDLDKLDSTRITNLIQKVESNGQTHGRGRSTVDHRKVRVVADALGVDYSRFSNFRSSL